MKRNFIPNDPVLNILGIQNDSYEDAIVISPAPKKTAGSALAPSPTEEKRETKRSEPRRETPAPARETYRAPASEKKELSEYLDGLSVAPAPKAETKSKRLNLLVKPSTLKEATKLAQKNGISVNELINRLLEAVVKK